MIGRPRSSPLLPYRTLFRPLARGRIVAELVFRVPGEFHVAAGAVDLLRLLEPLADLLLAVVVARLQLEERPEEFALDDGIALEDRKSTRLNSSHLVISYAVF